MMILSIASHQSLSLLLLVTLSVNAFSTTGIQMQVHKPPEKVVICGAGVIGASVAYYLSLRGTAAVIVDRAGFVFKDPTVWHILRMMNT
jgi:pyruvate/2-oxoglutarate dehydrogenase complex dihydrolipoamide dehydrogenase (E3) component